MGQQQKYPKRIELLYIIILIIIINIHKELAQLLDAILQFINKKKHKDFAYKIVDQHRVK